MDDAVNASTFDELLVMAYDNTEGHVEQTFDGLVCSIDFWQDRDTVTLHVFRRDAPVTVADIEWVRETFDMQWDYMRTSFGPHESITFGTREVHNE